MDAVVLSFELLMRMGFSIMPRYAALYRIKPEYCHLRVPLFLKKYPIYRALRRWGLNTPFRLFSDIKHSLNTQTRLLSDKKHQMKTV